MARVVDGLDDLLSDGFTRVLLIDVLHGTDPVATGVLADSWSLDGDIGRDPKTTGKVRIAYRSLNGESWTPTGRDGVLSPYKATLLLTEVISAGTYRRVVQLGLFDVVAVPYAQDTRAVVGARWVESFTTEGDEFGDEFEDDFPGELVYAGGRLVGGREVVVASVVELELESLDGRVLRASLRSPRTSLDSAIDEWRAVGLLPVSAPAADAGIPVTVWPAEDGSRLDAVQHSARALGGVPAVNSFGQWALLDDETPTVTLVLGERGTVVDISSGLDLDDFANVIIGNYEDDAGQPIRAEWVASGGLAPSAMGREVVKYHTSNTVRTQAAADAAVAEQGYLATTREVDYEVTCVYNPVLELGDHVVVDGSDVAGVAVQVQVSSAAEMVVTVRMRRSL